MGKQSRRQRKELREKRDRAESRGLTVGEVPTPKRRPIVSAAGAGPSYASGADSSADVDDVASVRSPSSRGWSSWPISIKLLLVGIFVLIAIGLYRRYTEGKATEPAASGSTQIPE
jgi:hypothetical protein